MIFWSHYIKSIATVALLCLNLFAPTHSVAQTGTLNSHAPAMSTSSDLPAASEQRILVIGDSLSAEYGIRRHSGWVELMRQRLAQEMPQANVKVINASISGDTTSGGVTRLPALLKQHQPTLVIIELGANDALRGLQMSMTRENLLKMVQLSQAAGAQAVLAGMQIPPNYGAAYTEAFRNVFPEVAQTTHAALIPFLLAGLETDRSLFIEDGIHPSSQAQPIILDNVWTVVGPLIEQ